MRVAIEGGEGVGKSSLIQLLEEEYPQATFVREPSNTIIGRSIREIIINNFDSLSKKEQTALFAVDRAYQDKITKDLDLVFTDRSIISNLVYQSSEDLSVKNIIKINKEINQDFKFPDKVILLNIDPEIAQSRLIKNKREMDNIDSKPIEFHKEISIKYKKICLDLENKGIIKLLILNDNYYNKEQIKKFIEK